MTRRRDPPPPLDFGPDPHNPGPYHDNRPPARDPRGRATPEPPHHHHQADEEPGMKLNIYRSTYRVVDHRANQRVTEEGYRYSVDRIEPAAITRGPGATEYVDGSYFGDGSSGHDFKTITVPDAQQIAFDALGARAILTDGSVISLDDLYARGIEDPTTAHYREDDERTHPHRATDPAPDPAPAADDQAPADEHQAEG